MPNLISLICTSVIWHNTLPYTCIQRYNCRLPNLPLHPRSVLIVLPRCAVLSVRQMLASDDLVDFHIKDIVLWWYGQTGLTLNRNRRVGTAWSVLQPDYQLDIGEIVGSISRRKQRVISFPRRPDGLFGHLVSHSSGIGGSSPWRKAAGVRNLLLTPIWYRD
jgi:hypothetical protein